MPVPGPMSRTMPEAVLRSGGISAEEPASSGSVPGVGVGAFFSRNAGRVLERGYISVLSMSSSEGACSLF